MKKIIFCSILGFIVLLGNVQFTLATNYGCQCKDGTKSTVTACADCTKNCTDKKGVDTCKSSDAPQAPTSVSIPNPLGTTDVSQVVATLINFVLSLVGSISLLLFIYGGITWMTSAGAPAQVKKGKDIVIWAIIGLAVVFTSYIMVKFVIQGITFGG